MASVLRTLAVFAAIGGIAVPIVATVAGWALRAEGGGALALVHDVRLSLWPMSRLFDAAEASRHWLYLPLATLLSNALIYAAVGALAAWGRVSPAAFVMTIAAAIVVTIGAHLAFETSVAGAAVAVGLAITALVVYRVVSRGAT